MAYIAHGSMTSISAMGDRSQLSGNFGQLTASPQQPAPVLISSGGQSALGQPSATNLASINSKEVAGLPIPTLSIARQQGVLDALHAQEESAQTKRAEAAALRKSAWAAFESALFTPKEPSAA
ncbi:hypothetical protein [Halothiobacillus sp. DCM-1]|uniref:hypothetical protein n=1 Tax=Halothiobacillus sp. DCM-1 TaxID=3112558 RepID=UPI0032569A9E